MRHGHQSRRGVEGSAWVFAAIHAAVLALYPLRPARSFAASVPGPSSFSIGLTDDPEFLSQSESTRSFWLQRAQALGSTSKISSVLHAAQRVQHAPPAGPQSIWITELDWATVPPITKALQPRFLPLGFFRLWQQGVSHAYWFLLRDPPGQTNSFSAGGLYFRNRVAKPSVAAFRFPFVAIGGSHNTVTLWDRAPAAGTVVIEKRVGRRWRSVLTLQTTSGALFYARRVLGWNLQLRARMGAIASPAFATVGRL